MKALAEATAAAAEDDIARRWAIAVIASREEPAMLLQTLTAAAGAHGAARRIDVVVNGNVTLATSLAAQLRHSPVPSRNTRVWSIALGDKANAWNRYVHEIWPGAGDTFFVDGYASVHPGALNKLAEAGAKSSAYLGAAGVPSMGRSAAPLRRQMLDTGGLHGNLFMLKGTTMSTLRERGIELPKGLYRTDALIGALLAFNLNPAGNPWAPLAHIAVETDATWTVPRMRWWRAADLKSHWQRRLRQSRGVIENAAIRDHLAVRRQPPEALPATIEAVVQEWVKRRPDELRGLLRRDVLARLALQKLMANAGHGGAGPEEAPVLVFADGSYSGAEHGDAG